MTTMQEALERQLYGDERKGRAGQAQEPFAISELMVQRAARALCLSSSKACNVDNADNWKFYHQTFLEDARAALEAALALARAEQAQEPVAWMYDWEAEGEVIRDWVSIDRDEAHSPTMGCHNIRPLYTSPQPAKLEPLTDDEITDLTKDIGMNSSMARWRIARAIEAAHNAKLGAK